jgi:crossover junction endodeoxyribonuclease RuvC
VAAARKIIGIDPGLRRCGWGIVEARGSRLSHLAHGVITPPIEGPLSARLLGLFEALTEILLHYKPTEAAMEEAFMAKNAASALKLGHARGAAMMAITARDVDVAEYAARTVKKSVVGTGGADKDQVSLMINMLLPGCGAQSDAADALAVAICHAHAASLAAYKVAS